MDNNTQYNIKKNFLLTSLNFNKDHFNLKEKIISENNQFLNLNKNTSNQSKLSYNENNEFFDSKHISDNNDLNLLNNQRSRSNYNNNNNNYNSTSQNIKSKDLKNYFEEKSKKREFLNNIQSLKDNIDTINNLIYNLSEKITQLLKKNNYIDYTNSNEGNNIFKINNSVNSKLNYNSTLTINNIINIINKNRILRINYNNLNTEKIEKFSSNISNIFNKYNFVSITSNNEDTLNLKSSLTNNKVLNINKNITKSKANETEQMPVIKNKYLSIKSNHNNNNNNSINIKSNSNNNICCQDKDELIKILYLELTLNSEFLSYMSDFLLLEDYKYCKGDINLLLKNNYEILDLNRFSKTTSNVKYFNSDLNSKNNKYNSFIRSILSLINFRQNIQNNTYYQSELNEDNLLFLSNDNKINYRINNRIKSGYSSTNNKNFEDLKFGLTSNKDNDKTTLCNLFVKNNLNKDINVLNKDKNTTNNYKFNNDEILLFNPNKNLSCKKQVKIDYNSINLNNNANNQIKKERKLTKLYNKTKTSCSKLSGNLTEEEKDLFLDSINLNNRKDTNIDNITIRKLTNTNLSNIECTSNLNDDYDDKITLLTDNINKNQCCTHDAVKNLFSLLSNINCLDDILKINNLKLIDSNLDSCFLNTIIEIVNKIKDIFLDYLNDLYLDYNNLLRYYVNNIKDNFNSTIKKKLDEITTNNNTLKNLLSNNTLIYDIFKIQNDKFKTFFNCIIDNNIQKQEVVLQKEFNLDSKISNNKLNSSNKLNSILLNNEVNENMLIIIENLNKLTKVYSNYKEIDTQKENSSFSDYNEINIKLEVLNEKVSILNKQNEIMHRAFFKNSKVQYNIFNDTEKNSNIILQNILNKTNINFEDYESVLKEQFDKMKKGFIKKIEEKEQLLLNHRMIQKQKIKKLTEENNRLKFVQEAFFKQTESFKYVLNKLSPESLLERYKLCENSVL